MTSAPSVRLGLVGCGRIAERGWIPAIALVPQARLVAVADPRPERCAIAPGARAFATAEELARSGGVDAVIVATPAAAHVDDAAAAAAAGVPVLVEKPPGLDAVGARALAALTPLPRIGFNRRFDPGLRPLAARARREAPVRLELGFRYRRGGWAAYEVDDDVLLDVGPHELDLARWLTGAEIQRVRTTTLQRDRLELELALEHGSAVVACDADAPYRESVDVRSHAGALVGRWSRGGVADAVRSRLRRRPPLVVSLAAQLREFAAAVRGEVAAELADAHAGVAVMDAVDAARESARRGGAWVEVQAAPAATD